MRNGAEAGGFSAWLDCFRWLAALSVLVTHVGIRMLAPVGEISASLPHAAYAFLAGFDHQAVMVFFVLSGFLVGGSVMREVAVTGHVAVGPYLLRRALRLCLVLWPAFALGAACTAAALEARCWRGSVVGRKRRSLGKNTAQKPGKPKES